MHTSIILPGATSISGEEKTASIQKNNERYKQICKRNDNKVYYGNRNLISKFEEFREHISALGIDKAIEIKQAGYDRHMAKIGGITQCLK